MIFLQCLFTAFVPPWLASTVGESPFGCTFVIIANCLDNSLCQFLDAVSVFVFWIDRLNLCEVGGEERQEERVVQRIVMEFLGCGRRSLSPWDDGKKWFVI
jgi:hypothetical protein